MGTDEQTGRQTDRDRQSSRS